MKISVTVNTPEMPKKTKEEYCSPPLREKVLQYIDDVDGYHDSYYQWQYLKQVYRRLTTRAKLTQEDKEIISFLEPVILKYQDMDTFDTVKPDSSQLNKDK